jgi:hypothetical protein
MVLSPRVSFEQLSGNAGTAVTKKGDGMYYYDIFGKEYNRLPRCRAFRIYTTQTSIS